MGGLAFSVEGTIKLQDRVWPRVNLINNCFLPGPDSTAQAGCVFPADPDKGTKVFLSGNIGPYSPPIPATNGPT